MLAASVSTFEPSTMTEQHIPGAFSISSDQLDVEIEIPKSNMNVDGLDNLIRALGRIRASMKPAHPQRPPVGASNYLPLDAWHVFLSTDGKPPTESGILLLVRSPLFGWQHYALDAGEASTLLDYLSGKPLGRPDGQHLN
jgi:hypothetical protein